MTAHFAQLSRYDLVAGALQLALATGALGLAGVYLAKRSGNRSSNVFFALLLAAFALSIGTLVLEHFGLTMRYPRLRYAPLWLTWTIGPAWFYYVKFSLFPAYRFRVTDLKHFVAPVAQLLAYATAFAGLWQVRDAGPVAGLRLSTVEEAVFLLSVGGYLFGAYRYLRFRAREIGARPLRSDYWKVKLLRRSQRVLFVLLTFNFAFVFFNFYSVATTGLGLLHLRGFYASSSLSFGLILVYLIRGVAYRQHFYPLVPPEVLARVSAHPAERLRHLLVDGGAYRDPDLHEVRVARAVGVRPSALDALAREGSAVGGWLRWVRDLRFGEVTRLRRGGHSLRVAALEAGFASRRAAVRAFRRRGR